jgi:hypothetical protein
MQNPEKNLNQFSPLVDGKNLFFILNQRRFAPIRG